MAAKSYSVRPPFAEASGIGPTIAAVLVVVVLLALPACAWVPEPLRGVQVDFQTSPSGATVSLLAAKSEVIGQSGTPLPMSIPVNREATLRVRFHLDGYADYDLDVPTASLHSGDVARFPADRPVVLVPTSALAPLHLFLRRHGMAAGAAGLSLLALAALILPSQRRMLGRFARLRRLAIPRDGKDPNLGKVIEGWLLTRALGSGGCATVYQAVPWESLDEREAVAMKVIHPVVVDDDFRRRFAREVNICRTLAHPNVVKVFDWHGGEVLCIVMELVRGSTLRRYIPENGMPLPHALRLLEPVIDAIAFAHRKSIVHNDLKPAKVLVTEDGEVRVMDFGIATGKPFTRLTATGEAMGTPAYMAPEQFDGIRNEPRSDQYSIGIMTFEMLTGARPFDDSDLMLCMTYHMTQKPPRVSDSRPDVPAAVSDVIDRMLAKKPDDRCPTMEEVWRALRGAAQRSPQG